MSIDRLLLLVKESWSIIIVIVCIMIINYHHYHSPGAALNSRGVVPLIPTAVRLAPNIFLTPPQEHFPASLSLLPTNTRAEEQCQTVPVLLK